MKCFLVLFCLALFVLPLGCAKTSCADDTTPAVSDVDDADDNTDDVDPCGLSCSTDADCVTPGPYCVKGQCREHPGPQGQDATTSS